MLSFSVSHEAGSLLVSSMVLTHSHNSGFNFICSGSWSNASYAPTLSRNVLLYSHHVQLHSKCMKITSWTDVSIYVANQQPYWLLNKAHCFNELSLTNMSTIFSTVCTAYNRRLFLLMSPHLLPFSANLSFQKRNGAKCGQYRGCRTAMPLYKVLTMVYDNRTLTLFGLSPSYILKHNTFQGQVWPHFLG